MTAGQNSSEQASSGAGLAKRLAARLAIFAGLFVSWIAVMAVIMFFAEVTPAAIALGQPDGILSRASDDTRLLRSGEYALVVRSGEPGYVRRLYDAGAWLVLPSLRNGCLDLR